MPSKINTTHVAATASAFLVGLASGKPPCLRSNAIVYKEYTDASCMIIRPGLTAEGEPNPRTVLHSKCLPNRDPKYKLFFDVKYQCEGNTIRYSWYRRYGHDPLQCSKPQFGQDFVLDECIQDEGGSWMYTMASGDFTPREHPHPMASGHFHG